MGCDGKRVGRSLKGGREGTAKVIQTDYEMVIEYRWKTFEIFWRW